MGFKDFFSIVLLIGVMACSRQQEQLLPGTNPASALYRTTFVAENPDYAVWVFRKGSEQFTYLQTVRSGWSADGKVTAELPVGEYKFLFTYFPEKNTGVLPAPQSDKSQLEDLRFVIQHTPQGSLLPGDELFLPEGKVDSVYQIWGENSVEAKLKRVVSQVNLLVKRGIKNPDGSYTALPYMAGDSILQHIGHIELKLKNLGTSLDVHGKSYGSGQLDYVWQAAERDSLTREGFATYTGPFFFPAADEGEIQFELTLFPGNDAPHKELSMQISHKVELNRQIFITAWITDDWNFIDVSVKTEPITDRISGEEGVWDDVVTNL